MWLFMDLYIQLFMSMFIHLFKGLYIQLFMNFVDFQNIKDGTCIDNYPFISNIYQFFI